MALVLHHLPHIPHYVHSLATSHPGGVDGLIARACEIVGERPEYVRDKEARVYTALYTVRRMGL